MNTTARKSWASLLWTVFFIFLTTVPVHAASPWSQKPTYWAKTRGKFVFGLKNTLFGWMAPWAEARAPQYKTEWEGFSAGVGECVIDTSAGLVQLGTFFIPVDFPDIGYGLPIPDPHWHPVAFTKTKKEKVPPPLTTGK